jgi:hypothetical protein
VKCGFYELDITPPLGSNMPGYFTERLCSEVRDTLFARAWVMKTDTVNTAVVTVDNCGLALTIVTEIKQRAQALCGISPENIIVACSHTHTGGPSTDSLTPLTKNDYWYFDYIVKRAADAIALAFQRCLPSELRFGKGWLDGFSFCRIYKMENGGLQTNPNEERLKIIEPIREPDKTVNVLEIRQEKKIAAVLVNFSCHCDVVGSETAITADYPGQLSRRLKEKYGQDTVVLFLQGFCGDINHINAFAPKTTCYPKRYIEMGDALADVVVEILQRTEPLECADVELTGRNFIAKLNIPDTELLTWAKAVLENTAENSEDNAARIPTEVDLFYANQAFRAYERKETTLTTYLQVLRIGELAIYAIPAELFSALGEEIVSKSPFPYTIVSCYSNDLIGYIATPECFVKGVYETRMIDGRSFVPSTGAEMVQAALSMGSVYYSVVPPLTIPM